VLQGRASAEKGFGVFSVAFRVGPRPQLGCGRSCGEVGLPGYREVGLGHWQGLHVTGGGKAAAGHLLSKAERGVLEWVVVHLIFQLFRLWVPLPRPFWLRVSPGGPCYRHVARSESAPLGAFGRGVLGQGLPSPAQGRRVALFLDLLESRAGNAAGAEVSHIWHDLWAARAKAQCRAVSGSSARRGECRASFWGVEQFSQGLCKRNGRS